MTSPSGKIKGALEALNGTIDNIIIGESIPTSGYFLKIDTESIDTNSIELSGNIGTTGQVIISDGIKAYWGSLSTSGASVSYVDTKTNALSSAIDNNIVDIALNSTNTDWLSGQIDNKEPLNSNILKSNIHDILEKGFGQTWTTLNYPLSGETIDLESSNMFSATISGNDTFPDLTLPGGGSWLFEISGDYSLAYNIAYTVYGDTYDGSTGKNLILLLSNGTTKDLYIKHIDTQT